MRNFPQELIDRVLDEVVDPRRAKRRPLAIADFGRVCKRWLPRSCFHVFNYLSLGGTDLEGFLDLVDTSASPLLAMVRELKLRFTDHYEPADPFNNEKLKRLQDCVNLASIIIRVCSEFTPEECPEQDPSFITYNYFLETHLASIGLFCKSLTRLELRLVHAGGWDMDFPLDIITDHIFVSLPAIEVFRLGGDALITGAREGAPSSHSVPACLETLGLNIMSGYVLFDWLLSLPVLPIIKSLELAFVEFAYPENWLSLHAYTSQAGRGLESLAFCTNMSFHDPPAILQHASRLRDLTLICNADASIPAILSSLTSYDLENIDISIEGVQAYDDIDQVLAKPQFRSLRRFQIDAPPWAESQASVLMPMAHARGILEFVLYRDESESERDGTYSDF